MMPPTCQPCARVVQSAKEKEAAAKQASTSAQKQARKNTEVAKKRAFQAPAQLFTIELSDDDDNNDETFFDVDADMNTPAGPANSVPVANSALVKSTA